jgi:hypothetical protein
VTRRVVWSDPKVLALAGKFVPGADNIDERWGNDPAVRRARESIQKLKQWTDPNTGDRANGQGIYIVRPTGELLEWASSGENSIGERGEDIEAWNDLVLAMMESALKKWGKPLSDAGAGDSLAAERNFVAARHAGARTLLRLTSRDLPRPGAPEGKWTLDWYRREWNLNYVGLDRDQTRALAPPPDATRGARYAVPDALIRRLAGTYLVDNVHGTAPRFADGHVKKARLEGEVREVASDGAATVRLEGSIQTENGEFGFDALLLGRAVWSPAKEKFVSFELVAAGSRRGAVHHSGRGPWYDTPVDRGPAPMGILCRLVEQD